MKTSFICLGFTLLFLQVVDAQQKEGQAGIPVDKFGGATVDPTKNVLDLVTAAVKRIDDLRSQEASFQKDLSLLADKRLDYLRAAESRRVDEEARMRSEFDTSLATKEAARLDSIREVDRRAVSETAAQANLAIANLAKQTTDLATTLAKTVTDTASATEARFAAFQGDTNKRLGLLETGASERQGKSTVADPQLEQLRIAVEKLAEAQSTGTGKSEGFNATMAMLTGVAVLLVALLTIGAFLFRQSKQNGQMLKNGRR